MRLAHNLLQCNGICVESNAPFEFDGNYPPIGCYGTTFTPAVINQMSTAMTKVIHTLIFA